MPVTESELKKHLKDGATSRVYFLYGEEAYLTAHYARQIASQVVGSHALSEFNDQRFDGQNCTVGDIEEAVEALPVMADHKCVTVRDYDAGAGNADTHDRLLSLVADVPEGCVLVFWLDAVQADVKKNAKWKSFAAAVDKAGISVEFPRKSESDLVRLLCSGAIRRNATLSMDNARLMVQRTGNDLNLLLSELDKLCALADGGDVTRAHIEGLGVQNLEASVFDLSKALLQGSYSRAYTLLGTLFAQREDPVVVLAVLSNAYADLYRARVALAAGVRAETLADDFAYKGKEFRLRNAARDGSRIPVSVLRDSLEVLAEADGSLKSSRTDNRVVLEQAIARLILLTKQGERQGVRA